MNAGSFAIAFLAIAAGSTIKGLTGLGLPVVAMPVLAYLLGVPHAIGILAIPIIATNLVQAVQLRGEARHNGFLWPMLGCGVVGVGIGTWLLTLLSAERLNLFLGLSLLLYIAMRVFAPNLKLPPRVGGYLAAPAGLLAGIAQGSTGLCAAIVVPFVHSLGLSRSSLIFCVSAAFLFFALVQIASLLSIGLVETSYLLQGLVALVPVVVFMPFGTWLGKRTPRRIFDPVFLGVLALVALGLIRSAFR